MDVLTEREHFLVFSADYTISTVSEAATGSPYTAI